MWVEAFKLKINKPKAKRRAKSEQENALLTRKQGLIVWILSFNWSIESLCKTFIVASLLELEQVLKLCKINVELKNNCHSRRLHSSSLTHCREREREREREGGGGGGGRDRERKHKCLMCFVFKLGANLMHWRKHTYFKQQGVHE